MSPPSFDPVTGTYSDECPECALGVCETHETSDAELCDKCHGNPGADAGGCFRCGGSGLARDHQPDIPGGETTVKIRDPDGGGMLYALGLTGDEARRLRYLLSEQRPSGTIGLGWAARPLQRLNEVVLPVVEADEARQDDGDGKPDHLRMRVERVEIVGKIVK